jgi:micrococcal nuclease
MKATRNILMVFLLALASNAMAQHTAKIVRVVDADTYGLLVNGKIIVARLTNIDAPELKQNFGEAAKQQVSQILLGKTVSFDSLGTDKYKRQLVSIRIDSKALDSLLLRNGWAWLYLEYCNDANLANLQRLAINEHKGLWGCGVKNVCPPWLYRHYSQRNRLKYCKGCNS